MAIFVPSTNSTIVAVMKMVLNAAPGYTYLNQFQDYVAESSMSAFASALCNYANPTADNAAFAAQIVSNMGVPAAAAAQATTNIAALLDSYGANRGGAILRLLDIMTALQGDAVWGATADAFFGSVQQAYAYSVNSANTSTDMATLINAAVVTTTVPGTDYALTAGADTIPGSTGDDVIVATDTTLSSADRIHGGNGTDELKVSAQAAHSFSAFEMDGVELVTSTADAGNALTFDMSGSSDVQLFTTLNSTGDVVYNQITALADLQVQNITTGANFTAAYQDTVVSGAADTVNLYLVNNYNANANTLTIGSQTTGNTGIETINVDVTGANTTITALNSSMTTLGITGDKNFTITNALNGAERTISADTFTGNLNIKSTATGAAAVTINTGSGNDTVTYDGTTGNHTVNTGAGNDTLTVGSGDDSVNLGAGADLMILDPNDLTVNDTIVGGDGADTMRWTTADTITKSEAEKVTAVETWDVRGAASGYYTITDNLLNTLSSGTDTFTLRTKSATAGQTIDLTNVTFSNTAKFMLDATVDVSTGTATNDTVVADDATINAKAILSFGAGASDQLTVQGDGRDVTITADDLSNISGLEQFYLQTSANTPQIYNIQLTDAFLRQASAANADATDGTAAVAATAATGSVMKILIDDEMPAGSVLNIDTSLITAGQAALLANALQVYRTANITVNVVGGNAGVVQVLGALKYTTNADTLTTMTGTAGDDTFVADFLNEVNAADSIDGLGHTVGDTLQLNFAVANGALSAAAQLNNTSVANVEILTFNTGDAISFTTDGFASITTVNFGSNNDSMTANTAAGTYNFGNGNNAYTEVAGSAIVTTVTAGTGTDTVTYGVETDWTAADTISLSTGTDTVAVTMAGNLNLTGYTLVSGVDQLNIAASAGVRTLTITDTMVDQTDNGSRLVINANDADAGGDGLVVNASAVTVSNAITVNVIDNTTAAAAGTPDFIGGAGDDIFNVTSTAAGTEFRGNGGADAYHFVAANGVAEVVEFATSNDGAAQAANTGYDTITGFQSGSDKIQIALGEGLANTIDTTTWTDANADGIVDAAELAAANGAIAWVTDAAVVFGNGVVGQPAITAAKTGEGLLLTHASTNLTDADLTESGFTNILADLNVLVSTTGAANAGGLVVVQGVTQSAVFFYGEQNGVAGVQAADLKLLGIVDAQLATGDFQIA